MPSFATILSALIIGLMPTLALAADSPTAAPFTDAQKAAIEDMVRELITKKEPEMIIKAAQAVQNRQESASAEKAQKAMISNKDKIFNNSNSPVGGNPKGDVAIVEFYDYQCGYCKLAQESVEKILSEDKNVKFIYKEYPILGANSVEAAKASVASMKQGKFLAFHDALMSVKDHLSDDIIFKVAKDTGLDVERLKKDMADKSVETLIKDDLSLGKDIGANGTPTFIIGDQLFPGAVPYDNMKKAIEDTRKRQKK